MITKLSLSVSDLDAPRSSRIDQQNSHSFTCTAMAGPITYSSFPRFARKRRYHLSNVSTMCLQLMKALATLSGIKSYFSRSDKSLASTLDSSSSHSSSDNVIARRHTDACVCHACLSEDHRAGYPSPLQHQYSSESTSPRSSIRSVSGKLRVRLKRSWSSWRSERSDPEPADDSAEAEDITVYGRKPDSAFIAELDALSLSEREIELLRRMEQVCESARAARERRHEEFELENDYIQRRSALSEVDSDVELEPRLRLRGGGDDDDLPFCGGRRRRTTLPPEPLKPDSARPNAAVWWLAGGKRSREGKVPTVGELRVRREVELANRRIVGFWGTVLGTRRVGKVGILQEDGAGGEDKGGDDVVERGEADAASVAAVEDGDGGSVARSKRERGIQVEDPGEAKAKSVASFNDCPGGSEANTAKDAVEDHAEAGAGSAEEGAKDPPEAKAESARNVAENTASEEAEDNTEPGKAEGPKEGDAADISEESKVKPPNGD
jgi:hypothetical protein